MPASVVRLCDRTHTPSPLPREVLERLACLRLLLAREIDAVLDEIRPGLGGYLECLRRLAARRQLENPRAVRVDPHLGDEPALEARRDEAQLEDEDRPEDGQVVELTPFGACAENSCRCSFEKSFRSGSFPLAARSTSAWSGLPFSVPEQTNPPGSASTSTLKAPERPQVLRQLARLHRAQLDDRVAALSLDPSRPRDDAVGVERELGGVEEEDLADLGLERVERERRDGRALVRLGNRQLQLDAVGPLEGAEQLHELLVRETRRRGGRAHWWQTFLPPRCAERLAPDGRGSSSQGGEAGRSAHAVRSRERSLSRTGFAKVSPPSKEGNQWQLHPDYYGPRAGRRLARLRGHDARARRHHERSRRHRGVVEVEGNFYNLNATYVFSDLRTWGWITLIVGALLVVAAGGVLAGSAFSRWFGIFAAGLSAISQFSFMQAYPFWT